ncbi:hypothetical protein DPMN_148964 [Dreissena polymorpha]|uniref:Mab-21-like HhH/H2TH-like domain-containing protein n=2 Tax=Dreissena polymorpha TaxID=45954 RepID=A0A9D4FAJ5_DREPO|nr:hypothetical protein DPMN_148964 [Dreissena polymorpha]
MAGCNLVHSDRIMLNIEDASVEMSNLLNTLGYGQELRQKRRDCYKELDRLCEEFWSFNTFEWITVGSKAEGLSRFLESDRDVLLVINNVECLEAGCDVNSIPENISVFRMDTQICYPGHCILLLERGFPLILLLALCENAYGRVLLSSDAIIDILRMGQYFFVREPFFNQRSGPSLPISFGHSIFELVPALRCHCPSLLQKWAARSRHWPPPNIVEKVVSMEAFLTPVGFKNSENKHIEWRICFNTGETELMSNLNDTQLKLYVLLKMIAKHVLKPQHKEITSYMLKNIILWLAENNPQSVFHERSLFFWVRESLLEVRTALSQKQLPYYMLPERNLMAATAMTDMQNRTWIATLTDMIDEGPYIIRRLPKVRQTIISHPEPLFWFYARRIELEIIVLEMLKSVTPHIGGNVLGPIVRNGLLRRMVEILREVLECSEEGPDLPIVYLVFRLIYRVLMDEL